MEIIDLYDFDSMQSRQCDSMLSYWIRQARHTHSMHARKRHKQKKKREKKKEKEKKRWAPPPPPPRYGPVEKNDIPGIQFIQYQVFRYYAHRGFCSVSAYTCEGFEHVRHVDVSDTMSKHLFQARTRAFQRPCVTIQGAFRVSGCR